jgi:predicted  nucleic acid-binding Zn-ribbon protein
LRTVIAPREAEALMHEIDNVKARHSELDDAELEHLETQERLDAEIAELDAQDEPLRSAAGAADAALAAQLATIDEEIGTLESQRSSQQTGIPTALLDRYETLRKTFGGVAIARLNGRQCEGCHLDISAAEIDTLKRTAPEDLPECPQCGRLIVV